MLCVHCGIQLKRTNRYGGGTWLVAVSQAACICPRNPGGHELPSWSMSHYDDADNL